LHQPGKAAKWTEFKPAPLKVIEKNCLLIPYQKVVLSPAKMGEDVNPLGAACCWLHKNSII
jgi:hypothetical protein